MAATGRLAGWLTERKRVRYCLREHARERRAMLVCERATVTKIKYMDIGKQD